MKRRFVVITVIALALGACGDPAGPMSGDGVVWPASVYSTTINIVTYRLYISPPEGRVGDNYRLIVQREPGNSVATEKTSSGKITQGSFNYTLQPSFTAAPTFTVEVDSTRSIVSLSGLITFDDGTTEQGPGSFSSGGGAGGSATHTHTWGAWTVTTPASCTSAGVETRVCSTDTSHYETNPIEALGHAWGAWTQTKAATVTEDGMETRTCIHDSSHKEERTLYATGTNGLRYRLINNTAYSVNAGTVTGGPVHIPACHRQDVNIEYLPVTEIERQGFIYTSITSVTFPAGLTAIGIDAFANCTGLASITIPGGVTSIGQAAFSWWTSSQTINVRGHASQAAADAAWGANWRGGGDAVIKYWNGSEYI